MIENDCDVIDHNNEDENETIEHTLDDVALAAFQGLLASGTDPEPAAATAWLVAVPAYLKARQEAMGIPGVRPGLLEKLGIISQPHDPTDNFEA